MSIASVGASRAIWGSAATALSAPQPGASGFTVTAKTAAPTKPAQRIEHAAQNGLHLLQEAAQQAGAFATDIMSALRAYRR